MEVDDDTVHEVGFELDHIVEYWSGRVVRRFAQNKAQHMKDCGRHIAQVIAAMGVAPRRVKLECMGIPFFPPLPHGYFTPLDKWDEKFLEGAVDGLKRMIGER
jgi:hypothetical protein